MYRFLQTYLEDILGLFQQVVDRDVRFCRLYGRFVRIQRPDVVAYFVELNMAHILRRRPPWELDGGGRDIDECQLTHFGRYCKQKLRQIRSFLYVQYIYPWFPDCRRWMTLCTEIETNSVISTRDTAILMWIFSQCQSLVGWRWGSYKLPSRHGNKTGNISLRCI